MIGIAPARSQGLSGGARRRPVRVLLVIDKLGFPGIRLHGSGRAVLDWSTAFDRRDVEINLCVIRDVGGLKEELRRERMDIDFLDSSPFSPRVLTQLLRLIRERHIDVLHVNGYGASTFGRLAGWFSRTPVIVHVHSHGLYDPKGYPAYMKAVDRVLARVTARAVVISEATRDFCTDYMGFVPSQVEVVHNMTPNLQYDVSESKVAALRERYDLPPGTPVVGILSRLYPIKGHKVLVAAFAQVLRDCPTARLLIVGDGPERTNLEAQARALGIERNVIFAGFQDDIAAHLRLCWVSVVPSIHPEPFGLVAVEALASRVPVIASRSGGLPEIITDGVAGLLVPPGDSAALAAALSRVLLNPDLRQKLVSRCLAESERFSSRTFTTKMERIYRDLAPAANGT
jgi:glycosyltransferase involved in cell wall biosynthesis